MTGFSTSELAYFRSVISHLGDGFALFDSEDRLLVWNEAYESLNTKVRDRLVEGVTFATLAQALVERGQIPEAVGREQEWIEQRIQSHHASDVDVERQVSDGRWFLVRERPTADGGVVGIWSDITAQKRAEENLRKSELRYRHIFDDSVVGTALVANKTGAQDGQFSQVNRAFCEMLEYSEEELLGMTIYDISYPEDHNINAHHRDQMVEGAIDSFQLEKRFIQKSGQTIWAQLSVTAIRDEVGRYIYDIGQHQNITGLKRIEEALRESQTQLVDVIESISEGFIHYDADERLVSCNNQYRDFYPMIDDILVPGAKLEEVARTAFERGAVREAVGHVDEWTRKRLVQHRAGRGSHEQHLADGRWILASERRTTAGHTVGIRTDITALKERENALRQRELRLRQLQTQLADMSRTSAMAQLSSELAHELNQPLTAVNNYLAAFRKLIESEQATVSDKPAELVNLAMEQAERANLIVRGLRDIVEGGETGRTIEDLNETVEEACSLVLISPDQQGIAVSLELYEALPPVRVNRVQIQQVVFNLVRNAVEAMERSETKELIVSTSLNENCVLVSVRDTGPGVSDEFATRLFQPFVSGKIDGMGIGLSVCRSIVEAHDGRLELNERTSGRTTFSFTLPAANASRDGHE